MHHLFIAFILIFSPSIVFAGIFGPGSYDDCILENMKGVTNEIAAKAIIQSCRKQFPSDKQYIKKSRQLSPYETIKLSGSAGPMASPLFGGNYEAIIYNGNDAITVTKIEVAIQTSIYGKTSIYRYSANTTINPLQTASVIFSILKGDMNAEYSWQILTAYGY